MNRRDFLLSAVGGYLLFKRPEGRAADLAAYVYGFAMSLTFDEFGMWLHLGGSYWQRASVDAVIILAALLALLAFAPPLKRFESHHFWGFIILLIVSLGFGMVIFIAGLRLGTLVGPSLRQLEIASSP